MRYVGSSKNVANRLKEWARGGGNVPQLQEVLRQYTGKRSQSRRHAFLVEPLFYMLQKDEPRKGMVTAVEVAMIEAYDSINHGWNLPQANVAMLCKSSAAIAKRKMTEASPETKARRSAEMNHRWSDPTYSSNVIDNLRLANGNPERRIKIAQARTGKRWITDGHVTKAIHPALKIPEGWWYGRT